jgi:DedD protein
MHGEFDEELEQGRRRRDTELTLSSTTLLGIFFGMVLLCGLFFGLGFAVGRYGPADAPVASGQTPAGAQLTTLVASSQPKPPATAQNIPHAPPQQQQAATDSGPASASGGNQGTASQYAEPTQAGGNSTTQPGVKIALPASAGNGGGLRVAPATAPPVALMVQIAAVSNPEDAEVLVDALRRHGYEVAVRREPADSLLHVQIGPFSNRNDAYATRQKLLNDGYNAIVQP